MNKNLYLLLIFGIAFLLLPTLAEAARCDCARPIGSAGCYVNIDTFELGGKSSCTIGTNKMLTFGIESAPCSDADTICQNNACPLEPSSSWNGKTCSINRLQTFSCATAVRTGKWNASLSQCVICSGNVKTHKIGDAAGLYVDFYGNYQSGADITDKCESACGADSGCDEETPNTHKYIGIYPVCSLAGQSYFQDYCDGSCNLKDDTTVCEASFADCTADPACDNKAPGSSCGTNKICDDSCQCVTICDCTSITVNGCCDGCNFCPAGKVFNGTSCVAPNSTYHCNSWENCDNGDCSATKRWYGCTGTSDSCSSSNYQTETVTASNGKVLKADCSQASPSTSLYCNISNSCTAGNCSGHKYYRACNGSGSCRSDNTYAYDKTVYANAGFSLTSNCGTTGTTLCDSTWRASSGTGDNHYGKGGTYNCQGMCDGSGNCEYAANCEGFCTGILSVLISGIDTCTVTVSLSTSNCDGKSWQVKDNGTTKCSGTVSGDSYNYTCSSWTVGVGSYTYNLYIDGGWKDSGSVTCLAAPCQCADGTPCNQCVVGNPPQYCNSTEDLVNKCSICDCPTGQICQPDGSCAVSQCIGGGTCLTLGEVCCAGGILYECQEVIAFGPSEEVYAYEEYKNQLSPVSKIASLGTASIVDVVKEFWQNILRFLF